MSPPRYDRPTPPAPFFSLAFAPWIPCALIWDLRTGEFRGVEGPRGFAGYREAVEASRFLTLDNEKL
jgi:hypothetical protein